MSRNSFKVESCFEVELELEGMLSPGMKGRMNMPNGDPGYPDEPTEIEDIEAYITVKDKDGKSKKIYLEGELYEALLEEFETALFESLE